MVRADGRHRHDAAIAEENIEGRVQDWRAGSMTRPPRSSRSDMGEGYGPVN
jgi:hypothetical protein